MNTLNPSELASYYRDIVKTAIKEKQIQLNIIGFLATDNHASHVYANYTKTGCIDTGINFMLHNVSPLDLEDEIIRANKNSNIHGIFVYYPIYGNVRDIFIPDIVDPRKDVEGLTSYWAKKLYSNERYVDGINKNKSILPCTPLAIIKLLESANLYSKNNLPLSAKIITVFNRSDVVGRPLAAMLSNDGALVYSIDIDGTVVFDNGKTSKSGIDRLTILKSSDVVITGVPSKTFQKIKASELKEDVICLNFSSIQNFEDDAKEFANSYIPRVGPLTIAMCLRNALRLYKNYHHK